MLPTPLPEGRKKGLPLTNWNASFKKSTFFFNMNCENTFLPTLIFPGNMKALFVQSSFHAAYAQAQVSEYDHRN